MPDRLHLLVEGQTEEEVVRLVLSPYLAARGWIVTSSIVRTKQSADARRGGVTSWAKIERDIRMLLGSTKLRVLTTLFDYYGFPADAPGMADRPTGSAADRVRHVERALVAAVGDHRFLPHLILHETETWVFAAGTELAELRWTPELADGLKHDIAAAGGAELINDSPDTAPSKRLIAYCDGYAKVVEGPLAIEDLGIEGLKRQCPHFAGWLTRLEALG
ncbi:DUF4276 family protein [Amycolatopsis sp. YIM 10]|uniref:DUF4276 family protein n=1 Tax=Amycolatopsis sp. YIM 10 TaxID=2653857 RepID=UPI00128FE6CF|nr:DUF4276 family protein [Amycolatopsis sp. YIM 10]QFU85300.1 hypothetical protein YIM_00330 [Amycolatopsis sp. YIM 10]